MTAVQEITLAIEKLPAADFWFLTNQVVDMRDFYWDQEMIEDAQPGASLDRMAKKALKEFNQGKTRLLS